MTKPKQITIPFAASGIKNDIPDSNGQIGQATWQEGFPQITMQPLPPDGDGVPPDGMDMNGILYNLSHAAQFSQMGVLYKFDANVVAAIGGYPKDAVLLSDDGASAYKSLVDGNTYDFNAQPSFIGQYWSKFAGAAVLATMTVTGSGNAITNITSSNGVLTATKGSFLPLTGGNMTGIVNNTAPFSYRKIAQSIDLSTTSATLREDWHSQMSRNPADVTNTEGQLVQLGAMQPANSQDLIALLRVANPRGGNLPSGGGANYTGIGVYFDYENNQAYGYMRGVTTRAASGSSAEAIASEAYVKQCVPKSTGGAKTPVYVNGNGVVAACSESFDSYLPLSGGAMTGMITRNGNFVRSNDAAGLVVLYGGVEATTGATLWLYGKDHSGSGAFRLRALNGEAPADLVGYPDGNLTWGGAPIPMSGAANTFIQRGSLATAEATISVTYPTPFSGDPLVYLSAAVSNPSPRMAINVTATGFTISFQTPGFTRTNWLAVGPK